MDAALAVLRDSGAIVEEVTLPSLDDFAACFRVITLAEAFAYHRPMLRRRLRDFGEVFRYRILPGLLVQGADYLGSGLIVRAKR
jgi:aspartyl-tRNA(Asn)/glutamyl-tRNA(Gln) amidotransferase subunit A